jgi:hypothetical protein
MKRRPWPIVILAILHGLAPIGNLFLNASLRNFAIGPYFLSHFLHENLLSSLIFFGLPPLAGVAIYACKKWSLVTYFVIMTAILIFASISFVQHTGPESLVPILIFYFFNFALVGYFLLPAVRDLYLDPQLRWWESAPRFFCDYTADYSHQGLLATGQASNISETGVFIRSGQIPRDRIWLDIVVKENNLKRNFSGQVLHHHRQDQVGFALRFEHTPESRQAIREIITDLRLRGCMMPHSQILPEDTFKAWCARLLRTGKGVVPDSKK